MRIKHIIRASIIMLLSSSWSFGMDIFETIIKDPGKLEELIENDSKGSWRFKFDDKHDSPLNFAIKNGDIETVKVLVTKGADLRRGNKSVRLQQNWKDYQNTPLFVAIQEKQIDIVKYLLSQYAYRQAPDYYHLDRAIFFFLKHFFNIKAKRWDNYQVLCEEQCLEAKILLERASMDEDSREHLKNLSQVLNTFISKIDIARAIYAISTEKTLYAINTNKILKQYKNLFISQEPLSEEELLEIANIFYVSGHYNTALQIMLAEVNRYQSLASIEVSSVEKPRLKRRSTLKKIAAKNGLIFAIYKIDEAMFQHLSLKAMLVEPEHADSFNEAHNWVNRLNGFVNFTILWPTDKRIMKDTYKYWLKITQALLDLGDMNGAMVIGAALANPGLEKILNIRSTPNILNFTDPGDNFIVYKDLVSKFDGKYIPSISVLSNKILLEREQWFKAEDNISNVLSNSTIKYLADLKAELKNIEAPRYKMEADNNLIDLLKALPSVSEDLNIALYMLNTLDYHNLDILPACPVSDWNEIDLAKVVTQLAPEDADVKLILELLVRQFHIYNGRELWELRGEVEEEIISIIKQEEAHDKVSPHLSILNIYYKLERSIGEQQYIYDGEDPNNQGIFHKKLSNFTRCERDLIVMMLQNAMNALSPSVKPESHHNDYYSRKTFSRR